MKRIPHEIIIIYWKDAALHGRGQIFYKDCKDFGLVEGWAAGFKVHEDKEQITIATDFFPKQKDNEDDSYRCLNSYPKSGIIKLIRKKY